MWLTIFLGRYNGVADDFPQTMAYTINRFQLFGDAL
jgi:hypothetical protein